MKLIINTAEFEHLKDKSHYNYNYYKDKNGTEILEIFHEVSDFYEYRLIEDSKWQLLGSSYYNMKDKEVEIDFRQFYN